MPQSEGKLARQRNANATTDLDPASVPPTPEIAFYITVGINETTQRLTSYINPTSSKIPSKPLQPLAVIFVPPGPVHLTSHLPTLSSLASYTSSRVEPATNGPSLVRLSQEAQERLSVALHIPRVSCIGIVRCPETEILVQEATRRIKPVVVPWLDAAGALGDNMRDEVKQLKFETTKIIIDMPTDERLKRRKERKERKVEGKKRRKERKTAEVKAAEAKN
jgi:hypothetical protein